MDRAGIFVDAGYLLAEAGSLCLGTKRRHLIACDYGLLHQTLQRRATEECGLPPLRTYWYDAALDAQPNNDQRRISTLPNLKLRLGRLSGGRQKGVDSLIVLDLLTLARERAITVAFVLSGDEDLREGILQAQALGVEVVLLGIDSPGENQAPTLVAEADRHIVLQQEFFEDILTNQAKDAESSWKAPPDVRRPSIAAPRSAAVPPPLNVEMSGGRSSERTFGRQFAEQWATADVPEARLLRIVRGFPTLPKDIDAPMLREAEEQFGSLREDEPRRRAIRGGFQERLRELADDPPDAPVSK